MCNRYQFALEQCEAIRYIVQAIDRKCGNGAKMPGGIRPTALVPVLINSDGESIRSCRRGTIKSLAVRSSTQS